MQIFQTFECSGQNLSNCGVNFETTSQFFSFASLFIVMTHNFSVHFKLIHFLLWVKECYESPNLQYHEKKLLCTFLVRTLYFLQKKNQSKCKFWEIRVLRSTFTIFLLVLNQQISCSLNFVSLFSAMRHNSSVYILSRNFIYFQ